MPRIDYSLAADDYLGRYRRYLPLVERRLEASALIATDIASRQALTSLRAQIQAAGLGRLGNALGQTSDLAKNRGVHRRGDGWSASGTVFIRTRSERSRGALEAYTKGAEIRPVRSRWMWIPTPEAPARIGRYRTTPELYEKAGSPLGPLVRIKSVNGNPLLVVRNVGKNMAGARGGRVRSLTKSGRPRKGDRLKEISVLFIGIPRTARAARVDVKQIIGAVQADLPRLYQQALERTFR